MRSGNVDVYYGHLGNVGANGFGWAMTGSSKSNSSGAYDFAFDAAETRPSAGPNNRHYGVPLC